MNPLSETKKPSICIVHDWLVTMRGGEKVLEALVELFPEAPIYTLFYKREKLSSTLKNQKIYTSFLQHFPGIEHYYRFLLPLFPLAIKSIDVSNYDLVISSSHCVAKSVSVKKNTLHICYCYTPMRYLWGFEEEYLGKFPSLIQKFIKFYFNFLKKWDVKTTEHVTAFITSSHYVAERIEKVYGRTAYVIPPPVKMASEETVKTEFNQDSYFLIVSALVPYKRIDIAIEAFNRLKLPLKIVGDGPLKAILKKMACFEGIQFEGWVEENMLRQHYAKCKALIFPGEEDFGIAPVEAQTFGKPVIAYGKGGILETVIPFGNKETAHYTGVFFHEQTAESLIEAIKKAESVHFDPDVIREHGKLFSKPCFKKKFNDHLEHLLHKTTSPVQV